METLLYLCSGGRSWDTQIAKSSAPILSAADAGESLAVAEASHIAEQPVSEGSLEESSQGLSACDPQRSSANGTDSVRDSRSKQNTQKTDCSVSLSREVGMLYSQPIWSSLPAILAVSSEMCCPATVVCGVQAIASHYRSCRHGQTLPSAAGQSGRSLSRKAQPIRRCTAFRILAGVRGAILQACQAWPGKRSH